MELTRTQKRIQERKLSVKAAYDENEAREIKHPVSLLVSHLAKKHKVTEVTIWNDIKPYRPK